MSTPIELLVKQLQTESFDLGPKLNIENLCGYGGKLKQFKNGNTYYRKVIGNNAMLVYGETLKKYLRDGWHDKDGKEKASLGLNM
jgi:hypothetical protein